MKNTFCVLLSALLLCAVAAQSQQTPQQMVRMNVGSVQGVAPGYNSTAGSGLSLNLSAGTVFCSGAIQSYAGGTLTMAPSTAFQVSRFSITAFESGPPQSLFRCEIHWRKIPLDM